MMDGDEDKDIRLPYKKNVRGDPPQFPEDWVPAFFIFIVDVLRNWTAGSRNELSQKVVLNGSEIGMLQFQTLFVPNAGWDD